MQQIVTKYKYALELLEDLTQTSSNTNSTLIICSTKADFFEQIIHQIHHHIANHDPINPHPITLPTLNQLATSSHIKLIFCPTVPTLRAYLSTHPRPKTSNTTTHRLIILDLLSLHHNTSEFTLQGLSRTFSLLSSTTHQTHSNLALLECSDITDPTNPARGSRLWDFDIPLLSGSIKLGQEGSRWAGRVVRIRTVARRWFEFARGDGDDEGAMKVKHGNKKKPEERTEVGDSEDDEMII